MIDDGRSGAKAELLARLDELSEVRLNLKAAHDAEKEAAETSRYLGTRVNEIEAHITSLVKELTRPAEDE